MMVRMNAGSVLFLVKCRYVTIYYLSGLFYIKAQKRQHLPLWWMLAFLCCGVELGEGKYLLEVWIYGKILFYGFLDNSVMVCYNITAKIRSVYSSFTGGIHEKEDFLYHFSCIAS